ncbi:peptidase M20 [Kushneria pakistanensis]|uniref:Peptidase M20 n=1 Tax=Kushneria pakistanensis TaxID=1508770 RepID=A0ABQ3FMA8_9GAMM|nr:M20 family metallopeptidase [Kushneria pakistanensis]GHC29657.1 peptidase M20 [Kushneria pakistanensis]
MTADAACRDSSTARISARIEARREQFIALADAIWDHPETRFEEHVSSRLLADALEAEGFHVERGVAGMATAFVASVGSGAPVIALLGEFDALTGLSQRGGASAHEPLEPGGNGHGCGHNLLGTAALAAAVAARDYLQEQGGLEDGGTLRFYGCPGEEGGSGKTFMVRDGLFDDVDAALTWHPMTFTGIFSTPTLANIQAYFRFYGTAAHAANSPHLGRSALDAVELMNVGTNYLREHVPDQARLHYAITDSGGTSPNVVQNSAEVLYLVRAPEMLDTEEIYARLQDVARGAALMTGTRVEVHFDKACSSYLPNRALETVMFEQMQALGALPFDDDDQRYARTIADTHSDADRRSDLAAMRQATGPATQALINTLSEQALLETVLDYAPSLQIMKGSTDVGDVSRVVPTAQCYVSCFAIGTALHTWQVVAQGRSALGHKGMLHAGKVLGATAVQILRDPARLSQARQELDASLASSPYVCPIGPDIQPSPLAH